MLLLLGLAAVVGLITGRMVLLRRACPRRRTRTQLLPFVSAGTLAKASTEPGAPNRSGPWGDVVALVVRIYRRKKFQMESGCSRSLAASSDSSRQHSPDGIVVLGRDREIAVV
jgi:hypothetical protein